MSGNGKDDFNRLRAQFSRRANAPEVPALASKLCWVIAFGRMDTKRRSTFVTQKTLANDLGGVTVRSVQRMIDALKPLGLNVAPGHGPDKASTYWIGEANTTSMSPIEADNTTSMSPIQSGQGDIDVGSRRHHRRQKATPVSPLLKKNSKKVSNKSAPPARSSADADRESIATDSAKTADDAPPNQRAPGGALIEPVAAQETPSRNNPIDAAAIGPDADPAFAAVYQRGREVLGAEADAVTAKLLSAYDGDAESALDTLARAKELSYPRQYVERDIEAAAHDQPRGNGRN